MQCTHVLLFCLICLTIALRLRQDKNGILYCWNEKSRKQLRDCIEAELEHLSQWNGLAGKRDGTRVLCWNYREFFVEYPCLDEMICVEGFFLKEALKVEDRSFPFLF